MRRRAFLFSDLLQTARVVLACFDDEKFRPRPFSLEKLRPKLRLRPHNVTSRSLMSHAW
jgi:hypothetical protein